MAPEIVKAGKVGHDFVSIVEVSIHSYSFKAMLGTVMG